MNEGIVKRMLNYSDGIIERGNVRVGKCAVLLRDGRRVGCQTMLLQRWVLERIHPLRPMHSPTSHSRSLSYAATQTPNTLRSLQNSVRQRIVSENIFFFLPTIFVPRTILHTIQGRLVRGVLDVLGASSSSLAT